MAYAAGDFRVQVRGTVGPAETWNNTWSFHDNVGAQLPQALIDIVHDFYDTLGSSGLLHSSWSATGATAKALFTGVTYEGAWASISGGSSGDLIPTQCAIRISLTGAPAVHGGAFISGWDNTVLNSDGTLNTPAVGDLQTRWDAFMADLTSGGWEIRIDSPTTSTAVEVTQARLGHRFDVIRKRGNDTPESFAMLAIA